MRSRGTANMAGKKGTKKQAAPAGRGGGRGKEPAKETGKGKTKRKRTWEDRASSDGSVDGDSSDDNVPLALRGKDARAAGSSSQHGGNTAGGGSASQNDATKSLPLKRGDAGGKEQRAPAQLDGARGSDAEDTAGSRGQGVPPHDDASDSDGGLGEIAGSMYTDMPWARTEAEDEQDNAADQEEPAVVPNAQSQARMEERMEAMNAEDDASEFARRFVFNQAAGDDMRSLDLDKETPAQADAREQGALNSHAFWTDGQVMNGESLKFGMWANIMHTAITWQGPSWLHDTPSTRYADRLPSGVTVQRPKISKMIIQAAVDTNLCGMQVRLVHALPAHLRMHDVKYDSVICK